MVGATGFEPATTGPPVRCATGLRYAPTAEGRFSQNPRDASRCQPGAQLEQARADAPERLGIGGLAKPEIELLGALAGLTEETFLGALEGQALFVKERLDPAHQVDVTLPVQALAGRVLTGTQQLELGLPVPQHVGGDTGEWLHLPDAVVELLDRFGRHAPAAGWGVLMRCFSPLLGLNVRTFRAVISMLSPVWGFRPRREALRRMRK